ncbi:hypothetical protein AVAK2825_09865 [Acidovorax sp. SUPP2825]|nr:hypothetical protein AVAK2825_09865 [Acidovorax sp. SUPP2825]
MRTVAWRYPMTVITRSVVSTAVALAALCAGPAQAHHG